MMDLLVHVPVAGEAYKKTCKGLHGSPSVFDEHVQKVVNIVKENSGKGIPTNKPIKKYEAVYKVKSFFSLGLTTMKKILSSEE